MQALELLVAAPLLRSGLEADRTARSTSGADAADVPGWPAALTSSKSPRGALPHRPGSRSDAGGRIALPGRLQFVRCERWQAWRRLPPPPNAARALIRQRARVT
jgi:hypothetical protein